MLLTLLQIEGRIRELAAIIYAPEEFIPTFGCSNQTGLPHIEISDGQYTVIVCENGVELSRESYDAPDELLNKVLHDISLSMASDLVYEDTNDQNFRERFLEAQKNILSKINRYPIDTEKMEQDTLTKKNTSALNESRKNILIQSKTKKKSLKTK